MQTISSDALAAYVPRMLLSRPVAAPDHWQVDGTLVFADVSGFTRLTEKLSRRGKVGAEEMVGTISNVFTALLSASHDGGDVLKFGGDALLILFRGDDHARRACHAARTMQRTLAEVGRIDSSGGRVRLRMSVGIHSGRLRFLLCGDGHLELHMLGETATTTVAMESAADAGEILVSPATAAAIDPTSVGAEKAGGYLLRSVPPLPPVTVLAPTPPPDAARYIPAPLRDLIGTAVESEHRPATIAFVHFGGTDALLRDRPESEVFERVQQLTADTVRACDEYGVLLAATDIAPDGGKFMLTAGAPHASPDDGERMLRTALAVIASDCGLQVRVGVNAGRIFAGDVGAPFRRTYSTMGDATNLAARVMGKTPWGEVMATRAVLEETRGRLRSVPVPPFLVKGKSQPVDADIVTGLASRGEAAAEIEIPLIGREEQLERLTRAIEDLRAGRGGTFELVGAFGSGRGRLLAELRGLTSDVPFLLASCDPFEHLTPYHTAREMLRRVLAIPQRADAEAAGEALARVVRDRAPALEPWLPLLAVPVGAHVPSTTASDEIAPRFRRERTHAAVRELVTSVVDGPAVVAIESAEGMDEASAALIAELLAAEAPMRPWLTVVSRTTATTGLHAGLGYPAEELPLLPLDDAAATALVSHLSERHPVPAHRVPEIVARGAGNPLFLAELVAAQAEGSSGELPRSIEGVLSARVDATDPVDRRVLRYASALGEHFDAQLLDAALGPLGIRSTDEAQWERVRWFLRRSEERFSWRNPLLREVAYEGLSYRRRRDLHNRIADALLTHGDEEARTWHLPLHLSRAQRWADAWHVARAAADQAVASAANPTAGELYELAMEAGTHLGLPGAELAEVAERAGDAYELAGMYDAALSAYTTARAHRSGPAKLQCAVKQGMVYERSGRYVDAVRWYGRAIGQARTLEPSAERSAVLGRLETGYAAVRYRQGRLSDCVSRALAALPHCRAAGDRATLAHAYYLLDAAYTDMGMEEPAAQYRDLALPIYEELGDLIGQADVLNNLGVDAYYAGQLDVAIAHYQRSREARLRAGDVVGAATAANNIAEALIDLEQLSEAEELLVDAIRVWRGARYPVGVAIASRNLGVVSSRIGDPDTAAEQLREALETFTAIGAEGFIPDTRLRLSESLLGMGRYVEAYAVVEPVLNGPSAAGQVKALQLRATALMRTGSREAAEAELVHARATAEQHGLEDVPTLDELCSRVATDPGAAG